MSLSEEEGEPASPSASQRLVGLLSEGRRDKRNVGQLSLSQARDLEEKSWSVVPQLFQGLVNHKRTAFMEVACSPNSILSTTVQQVTRDPQAAVRCSKWNGCDVSTNNGIRLILQRFDLEDPSMVWLSPPCGPYSPLQNANARNDRQRADLQEKRREALKIYIGVCVIVHYCVQRGTHVAVELAERCLAWRLPVFQKLQSRYQMQAVITKGCRVGLRGRPLMQKGWRVLTTHSRLAQTLDLPCKCPRSYQHDKCEGSRATKSELYTKEFARRAVRAVLQELDHVNTSRECQGQSQLHGAFGVGHCCVCRFLRLRTPPSTCLVT